MFANIIQIAFLCIVIGGASIPVSFTINSSPWVVWIGNALGSFLSALVVIYIGNRITSVKSREKFEKHRLSKKVVKTFDEGANNKKVAKARILIDKRGLRVFSLLCPIFPGVLLSTVAVYALNLDKVIYKRWMLAGVVFVSWAYVFGYWWIFVK